MKFNPNQNINYKVSQKKNRRQKQKPKVTAKKSILSKKICTSQKYLTIIMADITNSRKIHKNQY